jgi:hypothetical protein
MSTVTEEIIQVCEALPVEKRSEVMDFARFLLAQQDDERWEDLLADRLLDIIRPEHFGGTFVELLAGTHFVETFNEVLGSKTRFF